MEHHLVTAPAQDDSYDTQSQRPDQSADAYRMCWTAAQRTMISLAGRSSVLPIGAAARPARDPNGSLACRTFDSRSRQCRACLSMATDLNFADDAALAALEQELGPQARQARVVRSRAKRAPAKDGRVVAMDEAEEPQRPEPAGPLSLCRRERQAGPPRRCHAPVLPHRSRSNPVVPVMMNLVTG